MVKNRQEDKLRREYEKLTEMGSVEELIAILQDRYPDLKMDESFAIHLINSPELPVQPNLSEVCRIGFDNEGEITIGVASHYWPDFLMVNLYLKLVEGEANQLLDHDKVIRWQWVRNQ